ncbi:MAG TPA: RNA polymerase sigma factor [Planctomycetota bacterium]
MAEQSKGLATGAQTAGSNGAGAEPNWRAASDEQLLRAMAEGHPTAFDELFSRHSTVVLSFLARLTAARCDPEDLLQETFMRVLTHAGDFRAGAAFRPWLFTIARNVAYNSLQRRRLRSEVEVSTDFSEAVPAVASSTESRSTSADPSARMQSQEQRVKLLAALESLPPPQREIIVLVIYNGFNYEEAASITGDSEGTLRSRMFHALKRLRDRIKEGDV